MDNIKGKKLSVEELEEITGGFDMPSKGDMNYIHMAMDYGVLPYCPAPEYGVLIPEVNQTGKD
ncbi:hypothetical protein BX659_14518 [Orenia metallireducens]|uniref:Bacteriocin-type signal sequence-containing protein n=1 Tax=Orenia metallireducens TaxID=1413210 RepID=A0A285IG71_9FIRM|nr:hypothetical protein [Orenia metallireducens]PRX18142.1 hypothetical protein BX659_14518 [Orenia metallireducens]SNY46942.1 hypothetical protein SAMN06265827_14618 [Orenia metallireducens]